LLVGDCGTTWRVNNNMAYPYTINTKENLYCMDEPSINFDQYLCGEDGLFMVNGRITQTNTALDLKSFRITYDNKAIAVGEAGTILHTADVTESPYEKNLNGNNIRAWFMNNGRFNNHSHSNGGFEWPKGSNKYAKFSSGLILGGLVGSDTLLAVCDYDSEFLPGQTIGGIPQGNGTMDFKVFKIVFGAGDSDRTGWPNALLGNSNQGAPVFFDSSTGTAKPNDFGNQTMFYSYTDSYTESHRHYAGRTSPLICDVKQITYCFNQPEELKNVIYQEYRIINRSNRQWDEFYITYFSDDDLGDSENDAEATDTSMRLSYTYNFDNNDVVYGTNPPATGFAVIRAPYVRTGSSGDSIEYYEGRLSRLRTGIRETRLSANIIFHDDTWQPNTMKELYNTMKGLKKTGESYINPVNGQPTRFMYSGDPVTGTGWNSTSTGDMRFYQSFGPMAVSPGDTQIVVIAQVIARGNSWRSISELRETAVQARTFYDNMFRGVVINASSNSTELPAKHKLYQNYPNPFNPLTEIRFELYKPADVELTVFDISGRKFKNLENRRFDAGDHIVRFDAGGLSSGIYILQFNADGVSESMKMVYTK
ncbi:MAG: T9SS type A sorting domain-containing protein, partial [Ignavibacteria bacterium]|nr:T9SS type A sorting domain-containing protein [Ignavibacteria bacterium]